MEVMSSSVLRVKKKKVCVCVCVCVTGAIAQLVRASSSSDYVCDLLGLQDQVAVMASLVIISLGKIHTHTVVSLDSGVYDLFGHWGPTGASGAHTTVGIAVGALASTWPGSRRLLSMPYSSCIVHRNPANRLGGVCDMCNGSSLSIFAILPFCHVCVCVCVCAHARTHAHTCCL